MNSLGDEFDDDSCYEAEEEARAEAAYEYFYDKIGPEWALEHHRELSERYYEENYDKTVSDFTSECLASYYVAHPDLAKPAYESLLYARRLLPCFSTASFVFATTASELTVKIVLLKPIVVGLVHTEDMAAFIADLVMGHTRLDRFQTLLSKILAKFGGLDLKTFKRRDSAKMLWDEISLLRKDRNAVIHDGETVDNAKAELAISVATTLLHEIFPQVLTNLGLHLHDAMAICYRTHPKT